MMDHKVLEKARGALDRYVYLMTGGGHQITVTVAQDDFAVPDPVLDDAYTVAVSKAQGSIRASNPRAALMAVYHFLRENGCGFVRPGAASERIPRRAPDDLCAQLRVAAAHRFRGICIEGSCNLENTIDLLEWMPKVGFNSYFMQFREGYLFFHRWYACTANTAMTPWDFNLEVCRSILPKIELAAHENGLLYHAAGHGFTCECFGVSGLGWQEAQWPPKAEYALAQLDGTRRMHRGIPMISALCYSNPQVQKAVVEEVAAYALAHPEIDYLHFWLDDGMNNKCECEACRDSRVADHYVQMLNQLDEALQARGLQTRIVFLGYYELLWPPEREKINNPARFTFMFAPIERSFTKPFPDVESAGDLPPYRLNSQPFPRSNEDEMAHLKAWNRYRAEIGMPLHDSFDYDYYCSDYNDPGQFLQARLIHEDVRNLKKNGLGGIINCQAQRAFANSALPMYVMARALVQPEMPLETLTQEFFMGAFGQAAVEYSARWQALTEASAVLRGEGDAAGFAALYAELEKPLPDAACQDLTSAHSKKLMRFMLELYTLLARVAQCARAGDGEGAAAAHAALVRLATEKECEYAQELDMQYLGEVAARLAAPRVPGTGT